MKSKLSIVLISVGFLSSILFFQNCAKNSEAVMAGESALPSEQPRGGLSFVTINSSKILTQIDSAEYVNGRLYVKGWGCTVGDPNPLRLFIAAKGKGTGRVIMGSKDFGSVLANESGESAIANNCQSGTGNHRFSVSYDWPNYGIEFSNLVEHRVALEIDQKDVNSIRIAYPSSPAPAPTNPAPSPAPTGGAVIGSIDEVKIVSGQLLVRGWACSVGSESPIAVHLYAGGAGIGSLSAAGAAELERESAVASACQTASARHGFELLLTYEQRMQLSGKVIHVYGISPAPNGSNPDIGNSGRFTVF